MCACYIMYYTFLKCVHDVFLSCMSSIQGYAFARPSQIVLDILAIILFSDSHQNPYYANTLYPLF